MSNPRYSNGNLRRKHRARFKAMDSPCGICKGRLGPIHYNEPSDSQHPLSFVIDEINPVSKWKQFRYPSPQAAAQDWNSDMKAKEQQQKIGIICKLLIIVVIRPSLIMFQRT